MGLSEWQRPSPARTKASRTGSRSGRGGSSRIADQIWEHPELGLAEHFACDLQADDLAPDGFTITRNVGGMPTAFMAEWSQGEGGPTIGFLGEYDALPGLSQERTDTQQPLIGRMALGMAAATTCSAPPRWPRPAC